jgi:hypothetical protein
MVQILARFISSEGAQGVNFQVAVPKVSQAVHTEVVRGRFGAAGLSGDGRRGRTGTLADQPDATTTDAGHVKLGRFARRDRNAAIADSGASRRKCRILSYLKVTELTVYRLKYDSGCGYLSARMGRISRTRRTLRVSRLI